MVTYLKTEGHVPGDNNIHFMPCSIKYNGKANVSTYLIECKGEIEGTKKTSFRGYPLDGCEIDVPAGHTGYVIEKPDHLTPQIYRVQQSFKKLSYWNWDRLPSKNDACLSALDWLDVSKAIHSKTIMPKEKTESINDKR